MYEAKDFSHLLGTEGLSDMLLNNHFTLYKGYVTNTNKLLEEMRGKESGTPEFNELRRRFGWEWNGMRLHELYFGNLKNGGEELGDGELKKLIEMCFASFDSWKKDFVSTGAMRGIGWVVMAYDSEKNILINTWINEHDMGHLAGTKPLLVMDVFEHAYMVDYGLKKPDYIETFMKNIDWGAVNKRLNS